MWNDVRVRRAVMHAINRGAIVQSVMKDAADVANSIYIAPKYTPNDLDPYTFDPGDLARCCCRKPAGTRSTATSR